MLVTGSLLTVCSYQAADDVGRFHGESIERIDFERLAQKLAAFNELYGRTPEGLIRFAARMSPEDEAWDHLVFLRKSKAAGIKIGEGAVEERAKKLYLGYKALRNVVDRDPAVAQNWVKAWQDSSKELEFLPNLW